MIVRSSFWVDELFVRVDQRYLRVFKRIYVCTLGVFKDDLGRTTMSIVICYILSMTYAHVTSDQSCL